MPKEKKSEGYQQLSSNETETIYDADPAGAVAGMPRPKKKRTAKQTKWWKILCVCLIADLVAPMLVYLSTHGFDASIAAPFTTGPGEALAAMVTDSVDVVQLACVRFVVTVVLLYLTLTKGLIRSGNEDVLPHKMSDGARGQEENSQKIRIVLLIIIFLLGAGCSVYTGIKCIIFDFESISGVETQIAPFLAWSIGTINFSFVAVKKLVESYVMEAGVVLSPLHVHQLKYYSKGPPGRRRRKQCDICREGVHVKACYNCKDCNFNLCITCFETKSGELQGDEEENVVRGDKGKKEKTVLNTSSYFKRSVSLARGQFHLIGLAMCFLVISSSAGILLPNFQGAILDRVIMNDRVGFGEAMGYYIGFNLVQTCFGVCRQVCFSIMGKRIGYKSRNVLFSAILRQDIAFFDGMSTGQLTARLGQDLMQMLQPLNWAISQMLQAMLSLSGGLFMCLFVSWKLSMLAFTSIFPVIVITQTYAEWSSRLNLEMRVALGDASTVATEAFANIRTVRAFSSEWLEEKNYEKNTGIALRKGLKEAFGSALQNLLSQYTNLSAGILILWYGGIVVLADGPLSVGKLITFQLYWNMIRGAYQQINNLVVQFTTARGAAQRVFEMLDALPDVDLNAGIKLRREDVRGTFELSNVVFAYQMRPKEKVIDGITLTIEGGSTVAFVGKSGGGKSTMIHLLMRFYDPTSGMIKLDGRNLTSINLRSLHELTGLVAQDTQLFGNNVEENIAYGMEKDDYTEEQLKTACIRANAWEFIEKFSHGFQTRIGEKGVRLSGGQRQRIAIARVMLRQPKILFLDEATSALDTQSEALVQEALDTLIRLEDTTIVLVAHRLSTVKDADKICVLGDGNIMEAGTHDELLSNEDGPYAKLVNRQLTKASNEILSDGAFDESEGGGKGGRSGRGGGGRRGRGGGGGGGGRRRMGGD